MYCEVKLSSMYFERSFGSIVMCLLYVCETYWSTKLTKRAKLAPFWEPGVSHASNKESPFHALTLHNTGITFCSIIPFLGATTLGTSSKNEVC